VVHHDGPVESRERLISLVGSYNFRDLGGYAGHDGRPLKWGRLFRADTLHELTGSDVEVLRGLGLTTVIDLRTPAELDKTGRGLLANEPVSFWHLSVIGQGGNESSAAPAAPGEELTERYLWYLETSTALVEAVKVVADAENLPLVFHCAAGKDRTGVLAALILDLLGVEPSVIVADYLITAGRMELIMGRFSGDADLEARMAKVPAYHFSVEAHTMEHFVAELYARYGGARRWATAAGIDEESLDSMVDQLLEPDT
jgi:protein-tyrosine phosphatase